MKRISVIGGSGTGKTILANNLCKVLNLPVYHLDSIQHLKNWEKRDKKERDMLILEKANEEKWIIDGTYRDTLLQRLEKSDCIIYLDYSSFAQIKGVLSRFLKNHGKERKEIPGCKERMSWNFFWFVVKWRFLKRRSIYEKLNEVECNEIYIFKNRKQLNKWYKKQFNKNIKCNLDYNKVNKEV